MSTDRRHQQHRLELAGQLGAQLGHHEEHLALFPIHENASRQLHLRVRMHADKLGSVRLSDGDMSQDFARARRGGGVGTEADRLQIVED